MSSILQPSRGTDLPETYILAAYWNERADSIENSSSRLSEYFAGLASLSSSLQQWWTAPTISDARSQHSLNLPSAEQLSVVLLEHQNRENVNRIIQPDLGCQLAFYNDSPTGKKRTLDIRCGLYWKSTSPKSSIGNCLLAEFPDGLDDSDLMNNAHAILELTAKVWQPEWAGIMSESSMLTRTFDANAPFVDWMLYVPYSVEGLQRPSALHNVAGGSLIVVKNSPPAQTNEDLVLIQNVQRVVAASAIS
jgi:hypothetical protein